MIFYHVSTYNLDYVTVNRLLC